MVDRQLPPLTLRWVAAIVAFTLAVGGVALLVVSARQHRDARDDLTHARDQLADALANSSFDARQLVTARHRALSVRDHLAVLDKGAGDLSDLDQRDLDAVKAAIQAGLGGDLSGYNSSVDTRGSLDGQHDATVEQLRLHANAVIAALNQLN